MPQYPAFPLPPVYPDRDPCYQGRAVTLPGPGELLAIHQPYAVDDLQTLLQCLSNEPTRPTSRIPIPTRKALQEYLACPPLQQVPVPDLTNAPHTRELLYTWILGFHHTLMVRRLMYKQLDEMLEEVNRLDAQAATRRAIISQALAQLHKEIEGLYGKIDVCHGKLKKHVENLPLGKRQKDAVESFNTAMQIFASGWLAATGMQPQVQRMKFN